MNIDPPASTASVRLGELIALPSSTLLRLYAGILTQLIARDVIRSRNAPAGDLAESLVKRAYGGELAPKSEKSWDVLVDGRRLQVKCRVVDAAGRRGQAYSPFRSWAFDACVFVVLDSVTYEVVRAVEIDAGIVEALARDVTWVAGQRVTVAQVLACEHAADVTEQIRAAYTDLDHDATSCG